MKMAQTQRPLFFLTLILFSISIPTSLVRSDDPHIPITPAKQRSNDQQYYQVLDVHASIQKTLQVFSTKKSHHPTTITTDSGSSMLSFSLHPRNSIIKPNHKSYADLVVSRLAADAARANFISSNLQRALSKSEYKNTDDILPEDLEAPVTREGGGYGAKVGVGQPAREFLLVADTGSDINWVQCQSCQQCSGPIFDPSTSSTYKPLPCNSQQCTALRKRGCSSSNTCLYRADYGDNSLSIGEFATETLSFGSSGSVENVAIGCGRTIQGRFGGFSGILGLGGSLGLPSQVKATSFSYCLVDIDSSSSSTLEFNSGAPGDSVTVPLIKNPNFDVYYYVELTGITIGADQISIPASVYQIGSDGNGGIIVDSGTTLTLLETQVYNSVRDTFVKYTQNLPQSNGVGNLDTCYDLSSMSNVSVPKMSFQFSGGKTVSLPPQNYLIPVNSNGKICLAFASSSQPVSIIGNTQQEGFRVTYDLGNKLIGFSPDKC